MRNPSKTLTQMAVLGAGVWLGISQEARSQSTWVGPVGGTHAWNTTGFWDSIGGAPQGVDAEAIFSTNLSSALNLTWVNDLTLGKLSMGDTASGYFSTTLGASGNRLIFDVTSGNALLALTTPSNSVRDQIRSDVVLDDTLEIRMGNASSTGLEIHGVVSGSGGILRSYLADTNPSSSSSILRLANQNNSYAGATIIESGGIEIHGSVFKNQNSALGNSDSTIILGNANSPTAMGVYNTGATLAIKTQADHSEWVFDRDIDFSKRAESTNTQNWRSTLVFAANGSGGLNTNRLEVSGDLIIGNKTAVINAEREGMEVYVTGDIRTWLPASGPNSSAQNFMFNTYGAGINSDGVAGGTIRLSDRARTFTNGISLTNGTIVIEGSVGAMDTASAIGMKTITMSDGNGGNILSSEHGVRKVFMANAGTSFARNITLGSGNATAPSAASKDYYGEGATANLTNINVYNGFVIGGQNTTGTVEFSGNIVSNNVFGGANKKITLGHNLALIAATGGEVNFTGVIEDSPSADVHTRVTVNQFRNHAQLDTNNDGVLNERSNAAIGTATQGTVRLKGSNTYEGGTEVMGGTLLVGNSSGSATGTGAILVNTGTRFGGFGWITPGGDGLVLKSGATLTLGDNSVNQGIGKLEVFGTVSLNSTGGTILDFQVTSETGINYAPSENLLGGELNWTAITSGVVQEGKNDYFSVFGQLNANSSGTTEVQISLAGSDALEAGMAWNLWDSLFTSTLTEDHFSFNFNGLDAHLASRGLGFDTSHFHNYGILAITTVVPEPTRGVLGMVGLWTLLLRRKRKIVG